VPVASFGRRRYGDGYTMLTRQSPTATQEDRGRTACG